MLSLLPNLWTHCHIFRPIAISRFSSIIIIGLPVVAQSLSHVWLFVTPWTRSPCPSPSPGACSNFCPLSWWSHPTISSSVIPCFCLQSFSASGAFPMSQLFTSGVASTGASGSPSVLPMNIQGWFPLGLTGLISLLFKGLSKETSPASLWLPSKLAVNYSPMCLLNGISKFRISESQLPA